MARTQQDFLKFLVRLTPSQAAKLETIQDAWRRPNATDTFRELIERAYLELPKEEPPAAPKKSSKKSSVGS